MAGMFAGVLQIVFAVILTTQVLIPQFKNANQSGWSAGEIALWSILSLLAIGGVANGVANVFGFGF